MNLLELSTLLLSLASIFSIINLRILKLPQTIGLMVLAIVLSLIIMLAGLIFPDFLGYVTQLTKEFDFSVLLIDVMLPFLLFAGAISVDVHELLKDRMTILILATFGVLFSTFAVGTGVYWLVQELIRPWICRLFVVWCFNRPHRPYCCSGDGKKDESF